jgi:hypothetical protein
MAFRRRAARLCDRAGRGRLKQKNSARWGPGGGRCRRAAGFEKASKTEFNGDRRIANPHQDRADMRHFPPCKLRPQLASPRAGAVSFGCGPGEAWWHIAIAAHGPGLSN